MKTWVGLIVVDEIKSSQKRSFRPKLYQDVRPSFLQSILLSAHMNADPTWQILYLILSLGFLWNSVEDFFHVYLKSDNIIGHPTLHDDPSRFIVTGDITSQ